MAGYYNYAAAGNQGYANAAAYTPVPQPAQAVSVTSYNVPQTGFVQSATNLQPQTYTAYGSVTVPAAQNAYTSAQPSTTAVPIADTNQQAYQQNNYRFQTSHQQPAYKQQTTSYTKPVQQQQQPQQYFQATTNQYQSQPAAQNTTTGYYGGQNQQNNTVVQRTLTIPPTTRNIQPTYANSQNIKEIKKKVDRPTMPSFSKPQQKDQISNYEKALLSAATNYVNTNKRVGIGGNKNMSSTASYWKQKREMMKDPNKPIVASEVKGYLYAWLGKFRSRPDYTITPKGSSPFNQTFMCELNAPGFSYVGKGRASNKKDAQTRAAWDFCDFLVKEGKMKESELPNRENKFKVHSGPASTATTIGMAPKPATAIAAKAIPTTGTAAKPQMNFVGGSQLNVKNDGSFTETKTNKPDAMKAAILSKPATHTVTPKKFVATTPVGKIKKNSPIGEEFVEQVWTDGRVVRFRCSICECEFTDTAARDLHVRGRRHKLSYKKKVDSSIEVEVKLNPKQKKLMEIKLRNEERREKMRQQKSMNQHWRQEMMMAENHNMRQMYEEEMWLQYEEERMFYEMEIQQYRQIGVRPPPHLLPPPPPRFHNMGGDMFGGPPVRTPPTLADQHVLKKHSEIYPTDEELNAVQNTVNTIEKSLKAVSDKIHEQELKVYTASHSKTVPVRLLKAVLRSGSVAKGLLLKGELEVELVLLCNEKPTETMLNRIVKNLPEHLAEICDQKFTMCVSIDDATIHLTSSNDPKVNTKILITSTLMRTTNEKTPEGETARADPPNVLNKERCCEALAELRHTKWFQAKASKLPLCVEIIRIMKDLCDRSPHWAPLSPWALELLVANTLTSYQAPMSPSLALRRVFEVVSSGILLPGGSGLHDPCEKEALDAARNMTLQERTDLTSSAQHALRMLTYRQIHKILAMEEIVLENPRKRPKEAGEKNEEEEKEKEEEPVPVKIIKTEE